MNNFESCCFSKTSLTFIIYLRLIYFRFRECVHEWEGRRKRERERISSIFLAEPQVGLQLITLRSLPRVGHLTNCTT